MEADCRETDSTALCGRAEEYLDLSDSSAGVHGGMDGDPVAEGIVNNK